MVLIKIKYNKLPINNKHNKTTPKITEASEEARMSEVISVKAIISKNKNNGDRPKIITHLYFEMKLFILTS